MPKQCHPRRLISLTFLFIIPLAIAALCLGRYPLSLATVLTTLTEPTRTSLASNIILALRLPRIIGALLIGAALATAGSAYQRCFANPLVSPDLLGVANGAAVGAASAILLGQSSWLIQLGAFLGGIIAVTIAVLIPRLIGHSANRLILVLSGVIVTGFMQAALGLLTWPILIPNYQALFTGS